MMPGLPLLLLGQFHAAGLLVGLPRLVALAHHPGEKRVDFPFR